jgi:hypothetical protein
MISKESVVNTLKKKFVPWTLEALGKELDVSDEELLLQLTELLQERQM